MQHRKVFILLILGFFLIGLCSMSSATKNRSKVLYPLLGSKHTTNTSPGPFVISHQGGVAWVRVHTDDSYCPGDLVHGHGGEARGGPDGSRTWCFDNAVWIEDGNPTENGEPVIVSDTCGTNPPWDTQCWTSVDVLTLPSQTGINFWHLSDYLGVHGGRAHNGLYCLWCGSDWLWTDGDAVECGTWPPERCPGYGNQWNCIAQLELSGWTTDNTCTLAFDLRYDTECKYDYLYVEYRDGSQWQLLAMFNGSSDSDWQTCGDQKPNPDYYGFGDTGQPLSAHWVTRAVLQEPAFSAEIDGAELPDNPAFRWRFFSDGAWSDADGEGDTDGGAFIDNVWIRVDEQAYLESFEHNDLATLIANGWSFPPYEGIAQLWHQEHDPDPPYEGSDGAPRTTCSLDSSVMWRGRPIQGYPPGRPWRNGWFYRIMSPRVGIWNTGCVVQYDQYRCCEEYTCDYTDTKVRFHDSRYDTWCPWVNIDGYVLQGCCGRWHIDLEEDVTEFYGEYADSLQFAWDLADLSQPGDGCRGQHQHTDCAVDNVSIGFYNRSATAFRVRAVDLLHDSFHEDICGHNSFFDEYDPAKLLLHSHEATPIPWNEQMVVTITDEDLIRTAHLCGSIDGGASWLDPPKTMTLITPVDPTNPALGGDYFATLCPSDFDPLGPREWPEGTEAWYYVMVEDQDGVPGNIEYFPPTADPSDPDHNGGSDDYFTFSILPAYPVPDHVRILLVDGYHNDTYDYAECMACSTDTKALEGIYRRTLVEAGYRYDKFDINGAGTNIHIQPLAFDYYDAVVWFTGPSISQYLFDAEAQEALRTYLSDGGKVVLCGDRIAYNMADPSAGGLGGDALGGEFLNGIMACDYREEMRAPFDKPYIYLGAAGTIQVFGEPVPVPMESLLVYRECPQLKDMSCVIASAAPEPGYTAQSLLYVLNPDPSCDPSDGAIYIEKPADGGQCVFVNFDLSGLATHFTCWCDGEAPDGLPYYVASNYSGRVDLMRTILEDLFGLAPDPLADIPDGEPSPQVRFVWALDQNMPNPCTAGTEIRFEVARTSDLSIRIYDTMGRLVSVLENRTCRPGKYSVYWDVTNSAGEKVSSGVYFCKMEAGGFSATRKMLVIH